MSFLAELKRRNVIRVAAAYLVFAWVLLQVADVLFPALHLPGWTITLVAVLLAIGFVPALIGSWIYELTPEGIKRESEVERATSITTDTGRKLNIVTIAMVALGIALVVADRMVPEAHNTGPGPGEGSDVLVVAILPFKAIGSEDSNFLASGLHEDLLTKLHKIDAYRVVSRTSVTKYSDTKKSMREIGEELGAAYILEGSVQAMGDRVRINAQLIDAPSDEHLWAEDYDRRLTANDLFDVQADLATKIADSLHRALSPADRQIVNEVPTQNTAAYDAYLRALQLQAQFGMNTDTLRQAIELLEQAVSLDPEFAIAWARLSQARTRLARIEDDTSLREAALTALAEARSLQRGLIEAEIAWAVYLYHGQFEYEQALETLEALGPQGEGNPDVMQLKSWLYRRLGRFDEAHETASEVLLMDRRLALTDGTIISLAILSDRCMAAADHAEAALRAAPDSSNVLTHVAEFEMNCRGDAARASELMRKAAYLTNWHLWTARNAAYMAGDSERLLELANIPLPDPGPLNDFIDLELKQYALRLLGRDDEAEEVAARAEEILEGVADDAAIVSSAAYAWAMARSAARAGNADETRAWVERHRERSARELKGDVYFLANYRVWNAHVLAEVGLHDDAVRELREMLENPGGNLFPFVDAIPAFEALNDHPGYMELRERYGD